MAVQQVTPVVCPACNSRFNAPLQNIINGQDMQMKAAFLQGHANVVQCPQCGQTFSPNQPILYYDLEKELAFIFAPTALNIDNTNQEKIIGQLTNSLVESLPAEQRKFYLLNPKRFLSLESMIKAVLEADGITPEMMEAQESRVKLLEEFLKTSDEAALKKKVEANDEYLDYEFFEMLTAYMQAAQMAGDQGQAQTFFVLRTLLAQWSSNGEEHVADIDDKLGIVVLKSQEELLERIQKAQSDEEIASLVQSGHDMLDYDFFQKLTAKIDAAIKKGDKQTAETLKTVRTKVLELKAKQEEQSRQALEQASNLLKEILQSSRPDKMIEEKLDQFDEAFFFVLQANIEEAKRQGHNEPAQALEMLGNMVMAKLQEQHAAQQNETGQATEEQPQIVISKS